jgi:hypothetical protein
MLVLLDRLPIRRTRVEVYAIGSLAVKNKHSVAALLELD